MGSIISLASWWARWRMRLVLGGLVLALLAGGAFLLDRTVKSAAAANARAATAERDLEAAQGRERALRQDLAESVARTEAANAERAVVNKRLAATRRDLRAAAARITALDGEFRRLHDAAAAGGVPASPAPAASAAGGRDDAPTDAAAVALTITENYLRAEANRQQVLRLQRLYIDGDCR